MNSKVRKINIESLLFFDTETARRNETLDINSKEYELYAWSLRDKITGQIPESEEVIKHYEDNGALKPQFNRIVCISMGYVKGTTFYYKVLKGEQKEMIEEFYVTLNDSGLTPCGHNIIGFDMPVIRLKAFECGVDLRLLNDRHSDSQQKPWTIADNYVDTMDITKGTYFTNLSLDALCMMAGIDTPKDDISGADVSRVYYEGGIDRIATYCNKDIKAVAELFCALQGRKGFLTDFVNRDEAIVDSRPVLHKLHETSQLTKSIQEELREQFKGKKILKKDRENLFTILRGIMVRTDFVNMDQDTKSVIKEKEDSINEFLNTL